MEIGTLFEGRAVYAFAFGGDFYFGWINKVGAPLPCYVTDHVTLV